jgi:hypothetical protein
LDINGRLAFVIDIAARQVLDFYFHRIIAKCDRSKLTPDEFYVPVVNLYKIGSLIRNNNAAITNSAFRCSLKTALFYGVFPCHHLLQKLNLYMDVKHLLVYLGSSYYTYVLSDIAALLGIIVFVAKNNKNHPVYVFVYYLMGYFLLGLLFFISALFPTSKALRQAATFCDYIFTLFEFLIFVSFFIKILQNAGYKKLIKILRFLFMNVGAFLFIYDICSFARIKVNATFFLFTFEAIILLIPCLLYYLEIFQSKPTLNLLQNASFWVVTGLFFFMISTLPYSILIKKIYETSWLIYSHLFSLFYIFYIILFFMITRAYLCKPLPP